MSGVARNIIRALTSEFTDCFTKPVSALACPEPILVLQDGFEREAVMGGKERGHVSLAVLIVRGAGDIAESDAFLCERLVRTMDWEPIADAGVFRIVGIDTSAPGFKEVDSSGRSVWSFGIDVTAVREL